MIEKAMMKENFYYEKNKNKLLIKHIQIKMDEAKSTLYLQDTGGHLDSTTIL